MNTESVFSRFQGLRFRRGAAFGIIILAALIAFESFNFSTTDFALRDLLGDLRFAGVRWATILSIAFCGIDFAGIARLFTSEQGAPEPNEVWYLFGAWLLAATMNALLTWWGVSMAILNHTTQSSAVIDSGLLMKVVPVFVAVMVWLIRILIIGSLSYAGERIFVREADALGPVTRMPAARPAAAQRPSARPVSAQPLPAEAPAPVMAASQTAPMPVRPTRPAPRPVARPEAAFDSRPEPTYHSVSMRAAAPAPRPTEAPASRPSPRR